MISLWIIIGLIISALSVATLAAAFSIVGIGALFSGAMLAVFAMAGSLEFSKFVLAAYLHQRWSDINKVFRTYLTFAIVVLSLITSMGIFGFLSEAYQSASTDIEAQNIKLQSEKNKQSAFVNEIARLNRSIEEIPISRISKKLRARQSAEPVILELNQKIEASDKLISEMNLKVLDIKKKVGPLVYISKAFNADIDTVVKYLILVFVLVFDPLAICLVIATTQAIDSRKKKSVKFQTTEDQFEQKQPPQQNQRENTELTKFVSQEKQNTDEPLIQMQYSDDTTEDIGEIIKNKENKAV
jgi:hypothetical protein